MGVLQGPKVSAGGGLHRGPQSAILPHTVDTVMPCDSSCALFQHVHLLYPLKNKGVVHLLPMAAPLSH